MASGGRIAETDGGGDGTVPGVDALKSGLGQGFGWRLAITQMVPEAPPGGRRDGPTVGYHERVKEKAWQASDKWSSHKPIFQSLDAKLGKTLHRSGEAGEECLSGIS